MKTLLFLTLIPMSLFSHDFENGIFDAHLFHHNEFGVLLEIDGHLYEVSEIKHSDSCPCKIYN